MSSNSEEEKEGDVSTLQETVRRDRSLSFSLSMSVIDLFPSSDLSKRVSNDADHLGLLKTARSSDRGVTLCGTPLPPDVESTHFYHVRIDETDGCLAIGLSSERERSKVYLEHGDSQFAWRGHNGVLRHNSQTLSPMPQFNNNAKVKGDVVSLCYKIEKLDSEDTSILLLRNAKIVNEKKEKAKYTHSLQYYYNGKKKGPLVVNVKDPQGKPLYFAVYLYLKNQITIMDFLSFDEIPSLVNACKRYITQNNIPLNL